MSSPASGHGLLVASERAVVSHPAPPASQKRMAWDGGGLVARTTGRVFFTLDGVDYACSASTVGGTNPNVVVTAAHCVSDGTGGWAVNWTFVPGFAGGTEPYGRFTARTYFVSGRWANGADEDDDIAFVDMRQAKVGGVSRSVGDVVGAQPIAFGYRGGSAAVFGYPAAPPFNGTQLDYCQGPVAKDPYGAPDTGLRCTMTEGDSGGPWLSGFDPRTGIGVITGVTSFKYAGHNRTLYSANLGSVAQALYNRAEKGLSLTGHQSGGPGRNR
jgi:V8-like Glu-specific endopeptidase